MVVITHVNNTITPTLRIHACKVGGATGPDVAVDRVAAFSKYADEVEALCCVDANAGWTEADAMVFAAGVQPYAKYCLFLEQPLPPSGEGATLLHALRATCCLATPEHTHTHTHTHRTNRGICSHSRRPRVGSSLRRRVSGHSLGRCNACGCWRRTYRQFQSHTVRCVSSCTFVFPCVSLPVFVDCIYVSLHTSAHTRARTTNTHTHSHTHTNTNTNTRTRTRTRTHTHSHSHARTHARAHTHTHTGGWLLNQVLQGGWYHSHTSPSTPC
jgi:hypothetical protein